VLELAGCAAGAAADDLFEEAHHGAGCFLAGDFLDGGGLFEEGDAVGVRDFADEAGGDADAVVGEDGVGGYLLFEGDFNGSEGYWEVGRHVAGDAEAVGGVNDLVNSDAGGELEGGDVARLGEGV